METSCICQKKKKTITKNFCIPFTKFSNCYYFTTFVFLFCVSMHMVVVVISEPFENKLQILHLFALGVCFLKTRTFNYQNQKINTDALLYLSYSPFSNFTSYPNKYLLQPFYSTPQAHLPVIGSSPGSHITFS